MGAKCGWKIIGPLALKTHTHKPTSCEILHRLKGSDNLTHFRRVLECLIPHMGVQGRDFCDLWLVDSRVAHSQGVSLLRKSKSCALATKLHKHIQPLDFDII